MNIASTVNSTLIAYAAQMAAQMAAQQRAAQTEAAATSPVEPEPAEMDFRVDLLERVRASEPMEVLAHYGGQFA